MYARELIDALKRVDPETPVVIRLGSFGHGADVLDTDPRVDGRKERLLRSGEQEELTTSWLFVIIANNNSCEPLKEVDPDDLVLYPKQMS